MSKIPLIILLSYLFSGCLFASTKQVNAINTAHVSFVDTAPEHAKNIVGRAHELIGTPYRWGGNSASKGFDCSGLVFYLFRSEAGIHIPRTTSSMLSSRAQTINRRNLKPGDAVFFIHNGRSSMKHVGVYIGNGRFIHAPRTGKSIRIDSLNNSYWSKSYFTAKRFH